MSKELSVSERSDYLYLKNHTGDNCLPSDESVEDLRVSNLVLMAGQFVGAGKSTLINRLVGEGFSNVPSWTNRGLRTGEFDGVDKCSRSLGVMATKASEGFFLELEEVRQGVFYATPSEFHTGGNYVKDLELRGALKLRELAPELPIIIPLPTLREADSVGVTEWERRVVNREGFTRAINEASFSDLEKRLNGVVDETRRLVESGLLYDSNTLVLVNDDLNIATAVVFKFLETREKSSQTKIVDHLFGLSDLALGAL